MHISTGRLCIYSARLWIFVDIDPDDGGSCNFLFVIALEYIVTTHSCRISFAEQTFCRLKPTRMDSFEPSTFPSFRKMSETAQADGARASLAGRLLDQLPHGVYLLDTEGRVRYVNEAAERYAGARRDEMIGKPARTELAGLFEPSLQEKALETLSKRQEIRFESLHPLTARRFRYRLTPVEEGLMILQEDVSLERKEGETKGEKSSSEPEATGNTLPGDPVVADHDEPIRRLADAMPQLVWTARPDGTVDYYNERYREFAGITLKPDGRWEWAPVLHEDDVQSTIKAWQHAVETGDIYEIEHRVQMSDGRYRWYLSRGVPVRNEGGEITRWYGTATDIHDQKTATQALFESGERLRLALESAELGTWDYDYVTGKVYWDPRCLEIYASTADHALTFDDMVALIHPLDRDRVLLSIQKALDPAGTGEYSEEYRIVRPDETVRWVVARGKVLFEGAEERRTATRFIGTVFDSTERKHAEEAISSAYEHAERQRRRLRTVLDVLPVGMFITDAEGKLIVINQAAREIWGGEAPLIDTSQLDLYKGWWVKTGKRLRSEDWGLARALNPGETSIGEEVEIEAFDGSHKTILSYALPVPSSTGTSGAVAACVDITKLRDTERALRELNETLERRVAERTETLEKRNRELQQFAFIASHDMQEPLRKIQTFADLSRVDFGDRLDQTGLFYLDRIQYAAERMSQILADLLSFSRVTSRRNPFTPIRVDTVVQEVLGDLDLKIADAGATMEVEADVVIEADASQLRQLFNHVIMNAIKFSRKGVIPHVHIRVHPSEDRAWCRITIEDNGIGFEERYAERIFQPFERLHAKNVYPGTGMGLAICRRIVESHAGTITAQGKPGEGSCFIIDLPVSQVVTSDVQVNTDSIRSGGN